MTCSPVFTCPGMALKDASSFVVPLIYPINGLVLTRHLPVELHLNTK